MCFPELPRCANPPKQNRSTRIADSEGVRLPNELEFTKIPSADGYDYPSQRADTEARDRARLNVHLFARMFGQKGG